MAAIPPPPVANGKADACLNDAYQGGHLNPLTRVGRANKRRKTAEALRECNVITEQELGAQEVFLHQQATSALPPGAAIPGAPAWFGPAMAAALEPINGRLDTIDGKLDNIEARQANATAFSPADVLLPIHDAAGAVAPNFPATLQDLNSLTSVQRSQLLQFYGRDPNPVATRDQRLKQLFGIRP